MKIEKAIIINGVILVIYYTKSKCWQYAIASETGSYECKSISYTSQAAEREGRRQVQIWRG
jgi:hypothetical protein